MKPEYKPRRQTTSNASLVTEVTKDGKLVGAVLWSKNRNDSAFVEVEDLNAVGHVFKKLALRARRGG